MEMQRHSHGILISYQPYAHDSMLIIIATREAYDGSRGWTPPRRRAAELGSGMHEEPAHVSAIAGQMRALG
jgi:hypothetical protein